MDGRQDLAAPVLPATAVLPPAPALPAAAVVLAASSAPVVRAVAVLLLLSPRRVVVVLPAVVEGARRRHVAPLFLAVAVAAAGQRGSLGDLLEVGRQEPVPRWMETLTY